MNIENVSKYLLENGIKPSYQRKRIFEYLLEKRNHPNVNQIYEELIDEIPSLSKTTVYNTLNLFVDKKIAQVVTIEGNEIRYDLNTPEIHAHFKCTLCQMVYDIDLEKDLSNIESLKGFQLDHQYIHFTGVCPHCLKKKS